MEPCKKLMRWVNYILTPLLLIVVSHLSSWGGRRQKGGENDGKARGVEDKL